MKERRDKLEIIRDILLAIRDKGGAIKPTHLLYKSNLSHESMKKYIEMLLERELVEEQFNRNTKIFTITDKGLKFLSEYKMIKEFTESFGI